MSRYGAQRVLDRMRVFGDFRPFDDPRRALQRMSQTKQFLALSCVISALVRLERGLIELGQQFAGFESKIFIRILCHP